MEKESQRSQSANTSAMPTAGEWAGGNASKQRSDTHTTTHLNKLLHRFFVFVDLLLVEVCGPEVSRTKSQTPPGPNTLPTPTHQPKHRGLLKMEEEKRNSKFCV